MYGTPLEKRPFPVCSYYLPFWHTNDRQYSDADPLFLRPAYNRGIPPGIYRVVLIVDSSSLR